MVWTFRVANTVETGVEESPPMPQPQPRRALVRTLNRLAGGAVVGALAGAHLSRYVTDPGGRKTRGD